jgi:small subunit ribosomal protein S6|uniref:ribosomal protein S6 n=1 Tax=Cryptomonas pyrenoidifera TaxID=233184 RepID=UPI0022A69D20|nr:ribosomal protein S6 [Cryptomonas pyrenoidifera]UZS90565.1 ribosomal protein S6 [Cryptomonas pyrenoidifera]
MQNLMSYETIYLLKPDLTEDSLLKIVEQYQGILVERGARNIVIENRGRRHLKYPIKRVKDGVYIQMNYDANGEVISLIEKSMKINDSIVRYMTTVSN